MIYTCDECDYEGRSKMNLKAHVKQSCGECDYQGSSREILRVHVEIIQFGIKYKCEECNFQWGYVFNLRKHIKYKHRLKQKHSTRKLCVIFCEYHHNALC